MVMIGQIGPLNFGVSIIVGDVRAQDLNPYMKGDIVEGNWKAEPFRPSGKNEIERGLYRKEDLGDDSLNLNPSPIEHICSVRDTETIARNILTGTPPNLIGSKTKKGWHAPLLDLDLPCRLVPSGTPGHYHLYIDKYIREEAYKKLLDALYLAGIIQRGFKAQMDEYGQTFVRWGCLKGDK